MTVEQMKFYGKHRNFFQRYRRRSGNSNREWSEILNELKETSFIIEMVDSDLEHEYCNEACIYKQRLDKLEDYIMTQWHLRQ